MCLCCVNVWVFCGDRQVIRVAVQFYVGGGEVMEEKVEKSRREGRSLWDSVVYVSCSG